jgi:hypothetical protein
MLRKRSYRGNGNSPGTRDSPFSNGARALLGGIYDVPKLQLLGCCGQSLLHPLRRARKESEFRGFILLVAGNRDYPCPHHWLLPCIFTDPWRRCPRPLEDGNSAVMQMASSFDSKMFRKAGVRQGLAGAEGWAEPAPGPYIPQRPVPFSRLLAPQLRPFCRSPFKTFGLRHFNSRGRIPLTHITIANVSRILFSSRKSHR